jgi:F0F1-type ATP synthase assembly protein I
MKEQYKAIGSYSTLGLEIVLSVMIGFFGGRWLDGKLETAPYLAVVGFFFGVGAAGKAILRTLKEMKAVTLREEREQGNPAPLFESRDEQKERKEGSHEGDAAPITRPEDDEHT